VASTTEGVVTALDHDGARQWRTEIPAEFTNSMAEQITVDEHTAYVTFKIRGDGQAAGGADVLAVALDGKAVRH
jgi:hypothetical protein